MVAFIKTIEGKNSVLKMHILLLVIVSMHMITSLFVSIPCFKHLFTAFKVCCFCHHQVGKVLVKGACLLIFNMMEYVESISQVYC